MAAHGKGAGMPTGKGVRGKGGYEMEGGRPKKRTKRKRTDSRDSTGAGGEDDGAEGDDEDEEDEEEGNEGNEGKEGKEGKEEDESDDDDDELHHLGNGPMGLNPMGIMQQGIPVTPAVVMVEDGWAQCEECQKWRKLQPGHTEW
jgi:hypothetical protein